MMSEPMRVFLDTDIGPDCDDTAALAILLQLCREGRGQLIGATHCTGSPYGLANIDAICRLFGVSVPLGTCDDPSFLSEPAMLRYTPAVAERFEHGYPPERPGPDAVDALVAALKDAPEKSVTFVAIGPLNNVARFLTDPVAAQLMHSRVARMVLMAGRFDCAEPEWNVLMDIPAARVVAREWKGSLDLVPWEPLGDVLTGAPLIGVKENPVSLAYRLYNGEAMLRPSWDLGAVAGALLEDLGPFVWSEAGDIDIDEMGVTRLTVREGGAGRYLRRVGSADEGAAWLNEILARAVETMTAALV